jgi:hypothetical protein
MLKQLLVATLLVASNVAIHSIGMLLLLKGLQRPLARHAGHPGLGPGIAVLVYAFVALVTMHLLELGLWALFFTRQGCFDGFEPSLYFSLASYSTLGYGDLLLPREWRLLGGIEALTGVLMFGWSTGMIVALVGRLYQAAQRTPPVGG